MRSFHATLGAGVPGVVCQESDVPKPGPGQFLMAVRACSLNWREILVLRGTYPLPLSEGVVLACDGAGEVVDVGAGVDRGWLGRRVMPSVFPRWIDGPFDFARAEQLGGSVDGMLAEYVVVDPASVVSVPEHLSFQEAACLPCAGVTAWNALNGGAEAVAGESVLTLGSGGVSVFAIQIAKAQGARVLVTTGRPERSALLREIGADTVLDRNDEDWPAGVVAATQGGADRTVEVAGTLAESLAATAVGGELALVGAIDEKAAARPLDFAVLRSRLVTIRPVAVGSLVQFEQLVRLVATARLRPVIDRVFDFSEAVAALEYLERERPLGKVVVTVG